MSFSTVVTALESGDTDEVVSVLVSLTEADREAVRPELRRWLARGQGTRVSPDHAALAVLATAGGWRQAMLGPDLSYALGGAFVDHAVTILTARRPGWLPEFVDAVLEGDAPWSWELARGLVRSQAVPEPDNPEYFRGTVRALPDFFGTDQGPLIEQFDADPDLAGEHLLRMLSTEGTGRLLADHELFEDVREQDTPDQDDYSADTWSGTLLALSRDGRLDRGSLLDTILAAPLRDWAAADLGWYVTMHDEIEPTADEVIARQATYARLLTVEHGPSVKLAQRELLRIMRDLRFDPEPVVDASKATLARTDKASVAAQLRLLDKLQAARPEVEIVDTIRVAADHPRADIREQAARLLARLGESGSAAEVPPPFVAPGPEPWPVRPSVDPVTTSDELGEVLLGLMEQIDPIEMERAIDGLLRFADERPSTEGLLLSRAGAREYFGDDPRIAAATLIQAWLEPRSRSDDRYWWIGFGHTLHPPVTASPQTFVGALGERFTAVAQAVRRGRRASLALPSSIDFRIDADQLNRRLRSVGQGQPVLEPELVVALLRVPPGERASVQLPASWRRSAAVTRIVGGTPPTWERQVASHRTREWDPERRVPLFRDAHGRESGAVDGVLARSTPERTLAAESEFGEFDPRFEQALALGASLLPHEPDVLAAHAHPYLFRDLTKDRACCVPVLDAIARSRTVNGPPASSAFVLGLAAKDARARTAAQDALLDRARHGVLDGAELGRQAALLLHDEIVVGKRISTGLGEVSRASDSAVLPTLDAVQALVDVLAGRRDAAPFVELAADLSERTGRRVELPPVLRELAAGRSTSMLAKAARRLV